ncbi:MAG: hypothetical protein AAGF23_03335 [Acidobacteriota bacterium]
MPSRKSPPAGARSRRLIAAAALLAALLTAAAATAAQSPPRNRCTDVPGHVTCFTDRDGLIHGATVQTPDFTLTCRAFRRFWLQRFAAVEAREIVVAGVCEKRRGGVLVERWSTLDPLQTSPAFDRSPWASVDAALPAGAVEVDQIYGNLYTTYTGFYLPAGWDGRAVSETSRPAAYDDFPRGGPVQAWTEAPARARSVESPLFDRTPHCGPGFVVCSAYLKILHPDARHRSVAVEMVSARRYFSFTPGTLKIFEYGAEFRRRTF